MNFPKPWPLFHSRTDYYSTRLSERSPTVTALLCMLVGVAIGWGISKFEFVDITSVLESIIGCFLHQFSRIAAAGNLSLPPHLVPSRDHSHHTQPSGEGYTQTVALWPLSCLQAEIFDESTSSKPHPRLNDDLRPRRVYCVRRYPA